MAVILLGVSSSISIYKSLEVVSLLKKSHHKVYSILSKSAQKLISPTLFNQLSGTSVNHNYFNLHLDQMEHIKLSKEADCMVFIPATANTISKLTHGYADDLMMTIALCMKKKILVFPAMNPTMWNNSFVQSNVARLRANDIKVIQPDEGVVACGEEGIGKLPSPENIVHQIESFLLNHQSNEKKNSTLNKSILNDKKILITGGGSQESLDPIRVITNNSSGLMAKYLVDFLEAKKAHVTYLHSNVKFFPQKTSHQDKFTTTQELFTKINNSFEQYDALIMVAAPADFKTKKPLLNKIKKSNKPTKLELIPTIDILSQIKKSKNQIIIGFAAETENFKKNLKNKFFKKQLDLIIGNFISNDPKNMNLGIGKEKTYAMIYDGNRYNEIGEISKKELAINIIDQLEQLFLKNN